MKRQLSWLLGLIVAFSASHDYADNIVVFGASGNFGSEVVREALERGHHVYGVSRSPEKFSYTEDNFTAVKGNPTILESVKEIVPKADSIIVALGDREAKTPESSAMNLAAIALTTALADQGKNGPPVIVLGGGNTAVNSVEEVEKVLEARGSANSPRSRQVYLTQWETYQTYKQSNINWTFVATPLVILGVRNDGDTARTGKYRAAADGSLDNEPNTGLSRADIAVAMIDFAESGKYSQMRVMVAQEKPNN